MTTTARAEADPSRALISELDRRREALVTSAAASIDPDRFRAIALAAFTRTPALWECDPVTVARSIIEAAQLGLEPTGTLGGAYLVPFRNKRTGRKECQLIIGYRGMVDLARRSGDIAAVEARVVRAGDAFDYAFGLNPTLVHRPALEGDPGEMTHAYAIARFRSGESQFDVMTAAEIEVIRRRSRAGEEGPWITDPFEMAKKTVVRRLAKLLPLTVEARDVLSREDEWEGESRQAAPTRSAELRHRLAARLAAGAASTPDVIAPPAVAPEPEPLPEHEPDTGGEEPGSAFADTLIGNAEAAGKPGPATAEQRAALMALCRGITTQQLAAVTQRLWGFTAAREITEGQAAALLEAGEVLGPETFRARFVELVPEDAA